MKPKERPVPPKAAATVEHLEHFHGLLGQFVTIGGPGPTATQAPTVLQYDHTITGNTAAAVVDNRGEPGHKPSRRGDTAGQLREVTLATVATIRTTRSHAITVAQLELDRDSHSRQIASMQRLALLALMSLGALVPGCVLLGAFLGRILVR